LRFDGICIVTRDLTVRPPTADVTAIRHAATECLKRIKFDRKLRLLWARVSALTDEKHADVPERPQAEPPFDCEA
jgi:DNA polymerase IV